MRLLPESVRILWNGLEIRLLVLLSLTLQILLVFFAVFRKRSARKILSFLLWACYLGADYVATLALGILLSKQFQDSEQGVDGNLVALWAPFLLLHLGGPDAITSYALEDNELWLRHLVGLVVQVSTAILAFLLSLPNPGLWQPAIVVFISGSWKYAERTWTLSAASMDVLRKSMVTRTPLPNYVRFMQRYTSLNEAGLEARIVIEPQSAQRLSEVQVQKSIEDTTEVIIKAYELFSIFKRLSVDLMLSVQDRSNSQDFFFESSAFQAFRVVEIELSFLYDILHTKFSVSGLVKCVEGVVMRFLTFFAALSAALLFHHYIKHHSFNKADIVVTYVLLVGAVILEVISIGMLLLSDWMIVALELRKLRKCASFVFGVKRKLHMGKKWWSNSIRQYNFLDVFCKEHEHKNVSHPYLYIMFKCVLKHLRLKEPWDNIWRVDHKDVPKQLKNLIFRELKEKAQSVEDTEDYKRLSACRGECVLRRMGYAEFSWSIDNREYEESILLWHIATDLLSNSNYVDHNNNAVTNRRMSKLISNYMVYLLVMQPAMLPAGIGKIRFDDSCDEAMMIFSDMKEMLKPNFVRHELLGVNPSISPMTVKGEKTMSALFDACGLAQQLKNAVALTEEKRWELISAVWVELMCYAAGRCRAYFHAKQLSLGGELLTHVWLLMPHMGIGEQYKVESGGGAKLLVKK